MEKIRETSFLSWQELFDAFQSPVFSRLPQCRGDAYDPLLKERVAKVRDGCKKELEKIKGEFFQRTLEEQAQELQSMAPLLDILAELVLAFEERYRQVKDEKGAADFADLEHYALQILSSPGEPSALPEPSEAALEYRSRFAEVLVDEYQDINPVQEAILRLVSRPEPEGNLFMVGDVKQSIYRFRLAEPGLFLRKMRDYMAEVVPGECIALSRNFRSRREILAGVNFLFSQIMDETVGEMEYDSRARLYCGASYPPYPVEAHEPFAVEALFISASGEEERSEEGFFRKEDRPVKRGESGGEGTEGIEVSGEGEIDGSSGEDEEEELEKAALEGRLIAKRINELLGKNGGEPFYVLDRKANRQRPATYRDIVILARSLRNWGVPVLEELRRAGIPAYVELGTGYFEATEVEVMLSLLKVIDNPFQEIPLAAVLRSPLVGLSAEQLARVRTAAPGANYYEALQLYCSGGETGEGAGGGGETEEAAGGEGDEEINRKNGKNGKNGVGAEGGAGEDALREKLRLFLKNLRRWQDEARQGSLAGLLWQIYSDTGYYDLVGGMPGGGQRQANLRALYDRARQYEATALRGLFRFLRFIERIKERGRPEARALGEQEDVVRIITVHKSKGLEFPIVFAAGLAKQFNMQDLRQDFLLHRELGFGPKFMDTELRLLYPTLPWLALRSRLLREALAEEMRILYVALTRAQEKLILVAAVNDMAKEVQKWAVISRSGERLLPAHYRARAKCCLDWIGPALLRHAQAGALRELQREALSGACLEEEEPSSWSVQLFTTRDVAGSGAVPDQERELGRRWQEEVARLAPVPVRSPWAGEIARRLDWRYPYGEAESRLAKMSVTELRKLLAAGLAGEDAGEAPWFKTLPLLGLRPRFLGESGLTAAEKGTAYHTVMQHLIFQPLPDVDSIKRQVEDMTARELLTEPEKEAVDPEAVAAFFQTPLGRKIACAARVQREVPFSMALPASEVYAGEQEGEENCEPALQGEHVLIQGVIDCLVWDEDGLLLVDYKTDKTSGVETETLQERYRQQRALFPGRGDDLESKGEG